MKTHCLFPSARMEPATRWKFFLDTLETNPIQLSRQVDWIIKKNLIDSYRTKTGKKLSDTAVRNIDLQYHEVKVTIELKKDATDNNALCLGNKLELQVGYSDWITKMRGT